MSDDLARRIPPKLFRRCPICRRIRLTTRPVCDDCTKLPQPVRPSPMQGETRP